MHKKKVALVTVEYDPIPQEVFDEMDNLGVNFTARDCQTEEEFLECASDAFLVWTMGSCKFITPETLTKLTCEYIMRSGSGLDSLPVKEARELGIHVTNTPKAIAAAVAEHAAGLLLALARQIPNYNRRVLAGEWYINQAWNTAHVRGQTLGLVGFGHIASEMARFMSGFGMRMIVFDPYLEAEAAARSDVRSVELDVLLTESDFISIHCPLTDSTLHLFGENEFKKMKPSALLVNTSRGAIIDENSLIDALENNTIAGAALDVTEQEPLDANSPLRKLDNVIITPHVAAWDDAFVENFWRGSVARVKEIMEEKTQLESKK